jgi:TolB-like protein/class 3 adenylate cyclase/tetratricopeptide (TPR) repeat protein
MGGLMPETVEKRLTAILIMDIVGYSRQMAANEAGTLARVTAARREVFDGAVTGHGGRVVKLMGDGALVEFSSVSGAVLAARAIQRGLAEFNAAWPGDEPLQVRIGVNLGEVIVQDGDLYGDGVNVAARLEALAKPGTILIAGAAQAQLRDLDGVGFEDLGPQWLKNIPEPLHVFRITDGVGVVTRPGPRWWLAPAVLAAVVVLLGAAWWFVPQVRDMLATTAPSVAHLASESRPSLAVMPFENLSGDPAQSYFSDGMADSLISDLSQVSGLLVIARNTSFSFRDRGESMDARSVGAELGVRYVVAGSVQRAGRKVRISANLTDSQTGIQLWGARLDREFEDLFALQDDVTTQIIGALHVELSQEERRRLSKRYTNSLDAYDLYLRAYEEIWRFNEEARKAAKSILLRALRIDPDFALAKALLATTYTNRAGVALLNNDQVLDEGYRIALEAVAIDPDLPQVHTSLGLVHMFRREYAEAEAAFKRAVQIDPNYADAYGLQGWNSHYAGNSQAGWDAFQIALRLNPRAPFPYLNAMAEIQFSQRNYEKTLELGLKALERNPEALRQRLFLAAAYMGLERIEDARWEIEEALLLQPELRLNDIPFIAPYRKPEALGHLIGLLRRAGLPE